MNRNAFLDMRQVRYTYPGWPPVVDGVDWSIPPGEFHCLVGRSGCGKTTLLKLAAGLLRPDAGTVTLDSQAICQPGPATGFVFQSPTLLEWLNVLDNVLLPVSLQRTPSGQDREQAHSLLTRMGLASHARQHPSQLSGGQQSRTAIARALVLSPPILLMDEPFAALDAITREELQDALLGLCREQGTSVFFVTHDIAEAVYLADRVAVMEHGRLVRDLRVDLPRPRGQDVRYSPEFNTLCAGLRHALDGVPA